MADPIAPATAIPTSNLIQTDPGKSAYDLQMAARFAHGGYGMGANDAGASPDGFNPGGSPGGYTQRQGGGYEQFVAEKLNDLVGHRSVNGTYQTGPAAGLSLSQYQNKLHQDYHSMSAGDRAPYEARVGGRDIRSPEELARMGGTSQGATAEGYKPDYAQGGSDENRAAAAKYDEAFGPNAEANLGRLQAAGIVGANQTVPNPETFQKMVASLDNPNGPQYPKITAGNTNPQTGLSQSNPAVTAQTVAGLKSVNDNQTLASGGSVSPTIGSGPAPGPVGPPSSLARVGPPSSLAQVVPPEPRPLAPEFTKSDRPLAPAGPGLSSLFPELASQNPAPVSTPPPAPVATSAWFPPNVVTQGMTPTSSVNAGGWARASDKPFAPGLSPTPLSPTAIPSTSPAFAGETDEQRKKRLAAAGQSAGDTGVQAQATVSRPTGQPSTPMVTPPPANQKSLAGA